jgi:hypothetical protein
MSCYPKMYCVLLTKHVLDFLQEQRSALLLEQGRALSKMLMLRDYALGRMANLKKTRKVKCSMPN